MKTKMCFNISKCYHIKFTRKLHKLMIVYFIAGERLQEENTIHDLGVLINSRLIFVGHIDKVIFEVNKALGFVLRNTKVLKDQLRLYRFTIGILKVS